MVNTPVDINQVKQQAAAGHFRSIALWLNYPLVSQSIYARVQTGSRPGYLQVLLEFERPPKKDALVRLICNRICRLESNLIRGIHLVGRLVGTERPLWQQRVRLTQRQQPIPSQVAPPPAPAPVDPPEAAVSPQPEAITTTTYGSDTLNSVPSYLIPRRSNHQERRRRPNRSAAPSPVVQIRSATIDSTKTSSQRREKRRHLMPKDVIEQQFKYMRAIVVTGSAAAAFILGCVTETVMSQRFRMAHRGTPSLPTFNNGGWRTLSDIEVQEIAHRSSLRETAVSAPLETVAVMPHEPSSNPEDPTVTLVFGGEVPVGEAPLQTPGAVEQVLGDLDAYQEADLAMVGLGNSLASADTSLQENYFDRSRPDAVDALRQGGIDIVGLTGGRTMDFGRHGLTETLEALDGAGIYRVGAGRDHQEARRPEVLEVKGQRIAYLSYAPNSDGAATTDRAGINIQDRDGIVEDIAALRQAVDWIVVNYRWHGDLGVEPSAQQINLSRSAIDAGADLVVGYHPQQLQGAELYNSRPIVYALGDFIFQDAPLDDHQTAALRVSLRQKQMKVEFLPISVRKARPQAASGETAKAILKQIRQASEALPLPLQFPSVLDASPQTRPLLQPEKPTAPLKTLGELEPLPSVPPDYSSEDLMPEPETSEPGAFEPETSEPETSEPEILETNDLSDQTVEIEGQRDTVFTEPLDSMPGEYEPLLEGPLDQFNGQPQQSRFETSDPEQPWERPAVVEPIPEGDGAPRVTPQSGPPINQLPEQNDDIVLPSEQPLPGYDGLKNWGEKSSPHKEFIPVQEQSANP
ncbi:MAG: CapA family protein, partial [Cyanobacteria bacterium P01_D01_bin.2]